jgi:type II secretory pathway component PulK
MKLNHYSKQKAAPRGFILLAVLVFVLLLSMLTISLIFRTQSDETAVSATAGSEQAWSAAMSGVQEAMRVAAAAVAGSIDWQDDPATFRARPVYQDGAEQWYFTVFSPSGSDSLVDNRFGLSDEASRLNLNHPGKADFSKIPGLTAAFATALGQFIGQSSGAAPSGLRQRPDGRSQQQFTGQSSNTAPPGDSTLPALAQDNPLAAPQDVSQVFSPVDIPHHGPLATLDELLLLPGMSSALLHGAPPSLEDQPVQQPDANGPQLPPDDSHSKRSHGLDQYFTVFSRDPNLSNAGQPRCNLNDTNAPLPASNLPASFSNYVAALRTANLQLQHPSDALEATVTATDEKGVQVEIASGVTKENLPTLLDQFTTEKKDFDAGLVNVNTASATVLATLPGIDMPLAESIVATRQDLSPESRATIAWLYQEGVVDADKFKEIAPSLTARGYQFHFNVIGYGMRSGRYRVLEVVVDVAPSAPSVVYLRDITRLGLPLDLREKNLAKPDATAALRRPPGPFTQIDLHG